MLIKLADKRLLFPYLVLGLLATQGCNEKAETAAVAKPLPVTASAVIKKDFPLKMQFVGETAGAVDAEIRARVEGIITGVHFAEGKEVTAGQQLYSIDQAPYQAKVAEAQGRLAEAQTRHVKAQSDLKRVRPLAQSNALSKKDLDAAIAQEGAARGAVDAATAALESANIQLGYCNITSPYTGTIGFSKAKLGEFVGRAPNPVVLNTVSQLDPIVVRFAVSEKDYLYFARLRSKELAAGVEPEKKVLKLELADGSFHSEDGEVSAVSREIDRATGTFSIEAKFANPHKLIRPGQFAKVHAVAETLTGATVIPKRALRETQGQYAVFIVKSDNTVEQRNIKLGPENQGEQVVESGLNENELIVTEGVDRLRTGTLVAAQNTSGQEASAQTGETK